MARFSAVTYATSACWTLFRKQIGNLKSSPINYRLAKGAFWLLTSAIVTRALSLISSIVVARMLGKVGFGELGIIQSTIGMFGVFASFGMGLTATKHVAEFRSKDPAKAGRIIALSSAMAWVTGAIMALLLVFFAETLATETLGARHLARLVRISSLIVLMSAVNGSQSGALSGFEAFNRMAKISLFSGLTSFPLMVGGVYLLGIEGAVWSLGFTQVVQTIMNFVGLRRETHRGNVPVQLQYAGCRRELSMLWRFSIPAVLSSALIGPVTWLCSAILVNQPNGFAEMGIFNAANQWFGMILFLPGILGQSALPVLSEKLGRREMSDTRHVLCFSIKVNALTMAPFVLLGSLFSYFIMSLYGQGFAEAWPTLVTVLITAGIAGVQYPIAQVIAASGRMWLWSAMNLGWALCFVLLTYFLDHWGSFGLALARMAAYLVHTTWTFAFGGLVLKKCQ